MLKRRMIASVIVALAAVVGFGVVPPTASAAKSDCPSGFICIWSSTNYTGGRTTFAPPAVGQKINFVPNYDNNAESVYNHSSVKVVLYDAYICSNSQSSQLFDAGWSSSNLGSLNNRFSSMCRP